MMQAYNQNLAVTGPQQVVFAGSEVWGDTANLEADNATVALNKPGMYEVSVSGYGLSTAAGTFGFQLVKNGVPIPNAQQSVVAPAGENVPTSFSKLIEVKAAPAGNKAKLTLNYTGTAGTVVNINMIVKRVP